MHKFKHLLRFAVAVLSAYLGSCLAFVVPAMIDQASHLKVNSQEFGALLLIPLAPIFVGATGFLLFLLLAVCWVPATAAARSMFLISCAASGYLGIEFPPAEIRQRLVFHRPLTSGWASAEWQIYLLGVAVALTSGCIFLILEWLLARKRIQVSS